METSLLNQGLQLMLVGMGTVFVFLSVLVLAVSLMSRIVLRFAPVPGPDPISEDELAAIGVAIARYRGDV